MFFPAPSYRGLNTELNVEENFDEKGKPFVTVEELYSPWSGLCYELIPDNSIEMSRKDLFTFMLNLTLKSKFQLLKYCLQVKKIYMGFYFLTEECSKDLHQRQESIQ